MIQRFVVILLVMVVWVGCGEDEPEKVRPKVVDQVEEVFEPPQRLEKEIMWKKDGAKMVLISTGSFEMGDSKDKLDIEMKPSWPVHKVELDAFYIDINEVTVGQFKQFVNQSGYDYNRWDDVAKHSPTDEHPMVMVNWNDVTAYVKWAGKRLSTEAEWEYAARGGLGGNRYPWGDDVGDIRVYANCTDKVGRDEWEFCAPVGSFKPNGYGLYDMAGNVEEWCSDWYDEKYYKRSPVKNPQGPGTGEKRVLRGGAWNDDARYLRVASRSSFIPDSRLNFLGFRCVSGVPVAQ